MKIKKPDGTVVTRTPLKARNMRRTGKVVKPSGIIVFGYAENDDDGNFVENGKVGYRAGHNGLNGTNLSAMFADEYDAVDWVLEKLAEESESA